MFSLHPLITLMTRHSTENFRDRRKAGCLTTETDMVVSVRERGDRALSLEKVPTDEGMC